jgi:hypothetical protein
MGTIISLVVFGAAVVSLYFWGKKEQKKSQAERGSKERPQRAA